MNITEDQQKLFEKHLRLVIQANQNLNLTRIDSFEQGQLLHIEDSLTALPELSHISCNEFADLGTGGGFPGIPLSIASGKKAILVDSVKKKMAVIDSIIEELKLSDSIHTYAGRIEDFSLEFPARFSAITARALTSLPSLIELANPLLKINGFVICYKACDHADELEQACNIENKIGMKLVSDRNLVLSDGATKRSILVFEKTKEPQVALPRKLGMAQKRPFSK